MIQNKKVEKQYKSCAGNVVRRRRIKEGIKYYNMRAYNGSTNKNVSHFRLIK